MAYTLTGSAFAELLRMMPCRYFQQDIFTISSEFIWYPLSIIQWGTNLDVEKESVSKNAIHIVNFVKGMSSGMNKE